MNNNPSLFGIKYSNRDFTQKDAWGKNCFNSSFPTSLCAYLQSQNLDSIYLKVDSNLNVFPSMLGIEDLYGISPDSENISYAFESQFTPYQQYLIGTTPNVDLVVQSRDDARCLRAIEIKLTALPDNTTCDLSEDLYGCELVVRPDTIVYLACSLAKAIESSGIIIDGALLEEFRFIEDWSEASSIIYHVPAMINFIDEISISLLNNQAPFLMQPIWKTQGKASSLSEYCLDVFVWSNLSFSRLFLDISKNEIDRNSQIKSIKRHVRSIIWLFKMIYDFWLFGNFDHARIIDRLSYNLKNDKAFALNGKMTHSYMESDFLRKPRVRKGEIKEIILGGGQSLLSPERRLDAIIFNSPDLFF